MSQPMLICPFDAQPLLADAAGVRCAGGHCFDRAREGYLNLLPVQFKQAKDPGDSAAMVQARRAFLGTGAYQPLFAAIGDICTHHLPSGDPALLDAGCGEGAYLRYLKNILPDAQCYGLDISKHAAKAAAKSHKTIIWLVASNRQLPFPDSTLDIVLCAFGFPVWPEFRRVLKPGGIVIMADPASCHLIELRRMLYADIKPKDADDIVPDGFTLHDTRRVQADFAIASPDALRDLIAMTPHQHRAAPERIDAALHTPPPRLTLDVNLRVLQPR